MNLENYKIKPRSEFVSTSLQGYITATYAELVRSLRRTNTHINFAAGDGKVDIEWELQVEDHRLTMQSRPLTIYNWKDYDGGI